MILLFSKPITSSHPTPIKLSLINVKAPVAVKADQSKATVSRSSTQPKKTQAPRATTIPQKSAQARRYEDFLPSTDVDISVASSPSAGSERGTMPPDHLGRYSQPVRVGKDQSSLLQLANEFANYFQLPLPLLEVERTGRASLTWIKKDGEWILASADGTPYYRAFLFDAAMALKKNARIFDLMKKLDRDNLEVVFSHRITSISDLTFKELEYFADAGVIEIRRAKQMDDPKWQMLGANSAGAIGFNFLGAAILGYQAMTKECTECKDPEIIKLRESPAFSKPFKRF